MRLINKAGLEIIKSFEGIADGNPATVNLDPYLDPVGIWTIGFGHALRDTEGQLLRGAANQAVARNMFPFGITIQRAEKMLSIDSEDAACGVEHAVRTELNDNQFSAVVSLVFNIGVGNFKKSTMLKKLNSCDFAAASTEFARWNLGNGKVLKGLVKRREAERKLFVTL